MIVVVLPWAEVAVVVPNGSGSSVVVDLVPATVPAAGPGAFVEVGGLKRIVVVVGERVGTFVLVVTLGPVLCEGACLRLLRCFSVSSTLPLATVVLGVAVAVAVVALVVAALVVLGALVAAGIFVVVLAVMIIDLVVEATSVLKVLSLPVVDAALLHALVVVDIVGLAVLGCVGVLVAGIWGFATSVMGL